ncbi:HU family DNA-binding protein [Candidatus Woesearchaeota archaeon]|nr:HU family DNA-binding protein [Candidatus Woesearchaeota archaeon]
MAVRTRDDIARVLAPKMGMTHQDSERYLKELIAYMTKALKLGDEIVFRGFGRFTPKKIESRTAYDPRTREQIQVKSKIVVKFKPYGELVDLPGGESGCHKPASGVSELTTAFKEEED